MTTQTAFAVTAHGRLEAILSTHKAAQEAADKIPGATVHPMPVLDRVERVEVHTATIREIVSYPGTRLEETRWSRLAEFTDEVWDFQAPTAWVSVSIDDAPAGYGRVARFAHVDKDKVSAAVRAFRELAKDREASVTSLEEILARDITDYSTPGEGDG